MSNVFVVRTSCNIISVVGNLFDSERAIYYILRLNSTKCKYNKPLNLFPSAKFSPARE